MNPEVLVTTDTWIAIESIATAVGVLGAGVAVAVAGRQLWYMKQSRLDQNRPYVVVTFEQNRAQFGLIDIVVRNVGAGPAHNINLKPDPPLERAVKTSEPAAAIADVHYFNETIPLMPPGYELRTFFDQMEKREESDLPKRYDFTVTYDDGHGHTWTEVNVADLGSAARIGDFGPVQDLAVGCACFRPGRDRGGDRVVAHAHQVRATDHAKGLNPARCQPFTGMPANGAGRAPRVHSRIVSRMELVGGHSEHRVFS